MNIKLILSFILIFSYNFSQAQFLKRLRNRVQESIEDTVIRKAEQKAEKETSETFDDVVDGKPKKKAQKNKKSKKASAESKDNESNDILSNNDKDTPSSNKIYNFTGSVKFDIKMNDNDVTYEFLYALDHDYYAMYMDLSDHGSSGTNITVIEGDKVTSFIETAGMKLKMNSMGKIMDKIKENSIDENEMASVVKTGKTKVILGYTCEEYILTKDDVKVVSYMTTALSIPNMYFESKQNSAIKGFVLEYTADTKDGKLLVKATEINQNKIFTLNPSEYKKGF